MTILINEPHVKEKHIIQPKCITFQFNSILSQSSWNNELPSKPFSSESLSSASENTQIKMNPSITLFNSSSQLWLYPKCHLTEALLQFQGFLVKTVNKWTALPVSYQEKKGKQDETSHPFTHNWHREDSNFDGDCSALLEFENS